jgi:hopene-associated glycosyltransferase HpnB
MQQAFSPMLMPTILGALATVIWAGLVLARGFFWRDGSARAGVSAHSEFAGHVAAIVPARNEADVIGATIASLFEPRIAMSVFLVDDNSTDGTGDVARRAAADAGKSEALVVVKGAALPAGWSGKVWALRQGIERAREVNPDWLLLTDADVVHGPDTVAQLGAIASEGGYDLASFMVKLHCASLAEKLLIPAFVYFFFLLYPPAWIRDPRRSTAGAAGGCILVKLAALDRAGGVEAVRGALIDDCALARVVKQQGGRVWLGLTEESRSLRAYETFGAVGGMISRTAFYQLNHSAPLLVGAIAGMAVTYLAPPVLLLTGDRLPVVLGAVAWAAMTITYLPMVRYYRLNPVWALTLPGAALFYAAATVHSALKYWSGRGGEWKGRVQDVEGAEIAKLKSS